MTGSYSRDLSRQSKVPLSVVMPAYNEEDSIRAAVADVEHHVLNLVQDSELVVVDDGSRDSTADILDELSDDNAQVRVIHQINGGHGAALMTGLSGTSGEFVLLLDSDRQIPLDEFPRFWSAVQNDGYDCVFGVRRCRHDPIIRLWLTKLVRFALWILFGVSIYDANVPYKLLRRTVWKEAQEVIPSGTLVPSLFLAIFSRKRDFRVQEIDVPHKERETGEVSIRRLKLLKFCVKAFSQMWRFRKRLKNEV
jgi:dolichol-phosphate mannosyltransferase